MICRSDRFWLCATRSVMLARLKRFCSPPSRSKGDPQILRLWARLPVYNSDVTHCFERALNGRALQLSHLNYTVSSRLLIIGSQVRALVRPPPSLRKPHVPRTTQNRAYLRRFPATHFPGFLSLRAFARLKGDFGVPCLCIQKFRSRRAVVK